MQNKSALDPENRALYGEILRAPPGYELDVALATTYSLDFETALVIPATLAFQAAESRQQTLDTPLALLEGLERLASRIAIFCEAGRIKGVPKGANRLTALLEETITEVEAPGGGAFHPKIWILRFKPIHSQEKPRLRLALLSRNLTTDTSWDLSLCLDGRMGNTVQLENAPFQKLVSALPGLTTNGVIPERNNAIARSLAEDLVNVVWDHPDGVTDIEFAVNGLGEETWTPKIGRTVGIISPFVTAGALEHLTGRVPPEEAFLLSRGEELAHIPEDTLARFGKVMVLDELAETEDGEETTGAENRHVPARGLHAKAFVTQRYQRTEITMGSGNATTSALLSGANVEVFATLGGPTSRLGTVEEQLSSERLGRYLRDFTPYVPPDTSNEIAAEQRLDALRREIVRAGLSLHCDSAENNRIALRLVTGKEVALPDGMAVQVWPLVAGQENGTNVAGGIGAVPLGLGKIALRDVTRWLGMRLLDKETGLELIFSLGTVLHGLPEARTSEILRSIIENREAFLRYIRMLLGDATDAAASLFAAGKGGDLSGMFGRGEDASILEELVRALSGDQRPLRDIERLILRLGETRDGQGDPVIPVEFLALWDTFRQVVPEAELKHA